LDQPCNARQGTLPDWFQLGQQNCFDIRRNHNAPHNLWPKADWRCGKQFIRERDDIKVVVEVVAATAMLSEAGPPRSALSIIADAAEVAPNLVG
jgi:hypothetical protein